MLIYAFHWHADTRCSISNLTLLFSSNFANSSEIYSKLGQFKNYQQYCSDVPIQQLIFHSTAGKSIYFGQLKKAVEVQEGIGIAVYRNGDIYEGYWKDGKRNGKGRYIFNNKKYFIGDSKDGKWHGYGVMYFEDGNRYEGKWKDNKFHGKGVSYATNGDRYDGEYRNNLMNGQGTYYWTDGRIYKGEFKGGNINGQGEIYFTNNWKWIGKWVNGKRNGPGTEYAADGKVSQEGNWVNDVYVGEIKLIPNQTLPILKPILIRNLRFFIWNLNLN